MKELFHISKFLNEELKPFPICLELIISILLMIGIRQMYHGIEIKHPVYGILFGNLIAALGSSLINIFVFPFVTFLKYSNLANTNNTIFLEFYYSSWCVLSILRYFYIIHTKWLHEKFPDAKRLLMLSYLGIFFIFQLCFISITGPLMAFGWPEIKVFDMPFEAKLICLTIIVGNFMMLLGSSCVLYIAILRKRGQFCISKISSIDQEGNNSSETSLNQKRENSEINAAILSLETNLVLCALGCVVFIIVTVGSDNLVVIILILIV